MLRQRDRVQRQLWNDTHGWQSLMRSWSVVPGGRPRMYRLVLLSCSAALWLLLLVLGLGGAMGGGGGAYDCCRTNTKKKECVICYGIHLKHSFNSPIRKQIRKMNL